MRHKFRSRFRALLNATAFILLIPVGSLAVQQTLFNVPSSDVLAPGKVYAELDASFRTVGPKFSSFVPRIIAGLGRGIEAGVNIAGNIQPGPDDTIVVPTVKWRAYDGGENGWIIVAGDNLFIPIRNQSFSIGNYAYAQFSKTLSNKMRVTAGGYHFSAGVVAQNAQRAGAQLGFEQIVNRGLTLAADWYSGKHALGYLTPGLIWKAHSKTTGYFGYSIGNRVMRGNHFFLFEIGLNLN